MDGFTRESLYIFDSEFGGISQEFTDDMQGFVIRKTLCGFCATGFTVYIL